MIFETKKEDEDGRQVEQAIAEVGSPLSPARSALSLYRV